MKSGLESISQAQQYLQTRLKILQLLKEDVKQRRSAKLYFKTLKFGSFDVTQDALNAIIAISLIPGSAHLALVDTILMQAELVNIAETE